ncbi:MAG: carbohydrate binding family 9 domain-containing protein [Gemmatimonadetes bacterium]|nr:carbohydrate binding family 9 domain-containing protein [Gemmatimonadota bacterium]
MTAGIVRVVGPAPITTVLLAAVTALSASTGAAQEVVAGDDPSSTVGSPSGAASMAEGIMDLPRLGGPVEFDGIPDEAVWQAIDPLPLSMYSPTYLGTPSERTELRVAYDDEYLWVAAMLHEDDPTNIDAYSLRRDFWSGDDTFGILLDTFNDNENAVRFTGTPLGVRLDYDITRDGDDVSDTWDTFWDLRTNIGPSGWSGEMRIPFSSLRFTPQGGDVVMGMTVYRWTSRTNERVTFPAIPSDFEDTKVSIMQDVRLRGVSRRNPVYVTPYLLSGLDQQSSLVPSETAFERRTDGSFEIGADAKVSPSSNLTIDLSVNTDFADVEADQQQVNLTRFPLFFEEKRPFFLERAGLFAFSTGADEGRLFHSRRIGLVDGQPVRILGGIRAVGRLAGVDFGALSMQTARHDGGPSENLGVGRVRARVLNTTSYVGGMFTSRAAEGGDHNLTYGLDGSLNPWGDEYFTVKWLQTFQRRDGAILASGGWDDSRLVLDWSRRRVQGLSYSTTFTRSGPGYDPGVGFESRSDFSRVGSSVDYQWFLGETSPFRRIWIGHWGNAWFRNQGGDVSTAWLHPFFWLETKNGATILVSTNHSYDDTREGFCLSDEAEVLPGEYWMTEAWLSFGPPDGWRIAPIVTLQAGEFYDGSKLRLWTTLRWRASKHLELMGDYQLNRIRFDDRAQAFDSHLLGFRARAAWNSRLSAEAFVQYNSTIDRITGNTRLRYNFREGRDLWLVWNESLNTDLEPPEASDLRLPRTDARQLVLKYTHTLGL